MGKLTFYKKLMRKLSLMRENETFHKLARNCQRHSTTISIFIRQVTYPYLIGKKIVMNFEFLQQAEI